MATRSVSTGAVPKRVPTDAGRLARNKALMAAPISTSERSTVAATPVVTRFDSSDWAISTVIYSPSYNRPLYQSRGVLHIDWITAAFVNPLATELNMRLKDKIAIIVGAGRSPGEGNGGAVDDDKFRITG